MIKTANIEIDGKVYLLKRTWRSLMMFEDMTEKNVDKIDGSISSMIKLFYCIIKANNDFDKSFDQFIDMIDNDEMSVQKFTEYLSSLSSEDKVDKKKVR